MDVATGKSRILAALKDLGFQEIIWSQDGRGIFVSYWSKGFSGTQIGLISNPGGKLRAITKDTDSYRSLTLSSDGKTLATVQRKATQTLYVLPASGFESAPPRSGLLHVKEMIGWASDSELYIIGDGNGVLRMSTEGKNRTAIWNTEIFEGKTCPGGRYVVFTRSDAQNRINIWRLDVDSSSQMQLTNGKWDRFPVCAADGKLVYYTDEGDGQVKRVPIIGGMVEIVPETVPDTGAPAAVSADGTLLAFFSARNSDQSIVKKEIVLVSLDGRSKPTVRRLDADPRSKEDVVFKPDGKALVYAISENGTDNLWLHPLAGSRGHQITNFSADVFFSADYSAYGRYQYSPSGKSLAVQREHVEADVVLLRDSGSSSK